MELSFDLSSLGEKKPQPDPNVLYDLIIVGGGPAATTGAVYAARKLMNLALVTYDFQGQVGSTSEIENYMGYQTITGRELADRFAQQAMQFAFPIGTGEYVNAIGKEDGVFRVHMSSGTVLQARTVVYATGKRDRKLNVPGEDEFVGRGVAYCATCDAPFYKDLRVVVAGGGNSAFTAALDLLKIAKEVTVVNFAEGWQADEILQDLVKKYGTATLLDNHEVKAIEGDQVVKGVVVADRSTGGEKRIAADGIFIEIGLIPNSEPVKDLVALNAIGEVIVDCHCETSVEGFYGAGDVTTVPQKQIIISAGEGAKATLSAYDYLTKQGLL